MTEDIFLWNSCWKAGGENPFKITIALYYK
jgi:hypothetical protein